MIRVEHLSKQFVQPKRFRVAPTVVQAVRDMNFAADNGCITGLLGANGAGKTTTLRIVAGLLAADGCQVLIDGIDVRENPRAALSRIGCLSDSRGLYPRLTARENVIYYGRMQGLTQSAAYLRTDALGELLDMKELLDRRTEGFSQGERMKTALARALIHNPPNLLLDDGPVGVQLVVDQPVRTLVNNIRGTENILEETSRYRRRLLITSSSEVYGKGMNPEFHEDDDRVMGATSLSRWGYAASKAMDEFLALAYWHEKRHPVVIVRLFNTVGPRQTGRYGMVIPRFVAQGLRNEPLTIFGDGEQSRCFTYVGDVVPALIRLMERCDLSGEVFNIGGIRPISMKELAQCVIQKTGSTAGVTYVPYDQAYGPGFEDMRARVPSIRKIREAVGFEPRTTLDEILDVVVEDVRRRLQDQRPM